ncbi:MAG: hypothetical protein FWD62_09160 [Betaproteobacteria bacterium]|nr:hypothetical protein [Betaproteobacteria bacterium]
MKNFQFFPKSSIYDDDAKYRISEFNRHVATLYFIVRTKKACFLPATFSVGLDYSFRGVIDIAGHQLPIQFSCVDILFQTPDVQKAFSTCNEFVEYCMRQWKDPARPNLSSSEKYAAKAYVDANRSTANKLVIECPVKYSITREHIGEVVLSPYQLINLADANFPAPLEIIYIGKSNDDTWKRIYNHNKWGLIDEHRDETEELLVYFLEIDKSCIVDQNFNGFRVIARDESALSVEDATVATEAVLINYFVKEKKFNNHHVGSDVAKSDTIVDKVKARGYTDLAVECELEGPFGVIGTHSSGFKHRHSVHHKL